MLCDFLTEARLDAIGVFGYSDEDGTEAEGVRRTSSTRTRSRERVAHVTALAEELTAQRAEERIGERVEVLVESLERDPTRATSSPRAGPPTRVPRSTARRPCAGLPTGTRVGDMIRARVVGTDGVDLEAVGEPTRSAAAEEGR